MAGPSKKGTGRVGKALRNTGLFLANLAGATSLSLGGAQARAEPQPPGPPTPQPQGPVRAPESPNRPNTPAPGERTPTLAERDIRDRRSGLLRPRGKNGEGGGGPEPMNDLLQDKDRIFTNLYGFHDWGLEGAKQRGCWNATA